MIRTFLLLSLLAAAVANAADRPNILYLLADDASWNHIGAYGCKAARTPAIDRLAHDGARFNFAFCNSPSCTPSRGAMLTGQDIGRLGAAANLWSFWPDTAAVYPDLLERAGYKIGMSGKGWAPGNFQRSGRRNNPAGPNIPFEKFLDGLPKDVPFCYWFGSHHPHRPYEKGSGVKAGFKPEDVVVPPTLPDTPEVRSDICDYLEAIRMFDDEVARYLAALEKSGRRENTIIVVSSDNGFPFPRGKANLYDGGTREPLIFVWPSHIKPGTVLDDFATLADLAPTFLEAAGLPVPTNMTARSLLPVLLAGKSGRVDPSRDRAFFGRERHASVRADNLGYPARAIRTAEFLYIKNFAPGRWPAGDPPMFGDIDEFDNITGSASKAAVLVDQKSHLFELAAAKRPAEELYDLAKDPDQLVNIAADSAYAGPREKLSAELEKHLRETADPRGTGGGDAFDRYEYFHPEKNGSPRPAP